MYGSPTDILEIFAKKSEPSHHFQRDRVLSIRHLPLVLIALLAFGVALLRWRLAIARARMFSTWTEARLTPDGLIEDEHGATLGTLERHRTKKGGPGVLLVAPAALSTSGLYRDVPIVQRTNVVEGPRERWARAATLCLRDARVLAILIIASILLAFGARLFAG